MTQEITTVTPLVHSAITLKDPSGVVARKVILKREDSICVQVRSQDPLIETLRYFVATSLSHQFHLFESGFSLNSP